MVKEKDVSLLMRIEGQLNSNSRRGFQIMAASQITKLQQMLQAAVQGVEWTYSVFWQICPQQGVLVWGDGYYNGTIKTRKTLQPMEVSAEEVCLQRSQQLRELYDSLSAGESNQPARRPCAALSPEDLTESEWFYLMCVSFSFPPGIGLPGKALARRHHVWLTGTNEADSKVFSRAILAKSAGIQTIVCIPVMDGVLELGTIERVQENLGLIQRAKNLFLGNQRHSKPALSEHSTSDPIATNDQQSLHSPPLAAPFPVMEPQNPDPEPEPEIEAEHESNTSVEDEIGQEITEQATHEDPSQLSQMAHNYAGVAVEPNELMQLDMLEDIQIGSPEDYSNKLDTELQLLDVSNSGGESIDRNGRATECFRAESTRVWPPLQDEFNIDLPTLGVCQIEYLTPADAHYSQTLSTILQQNSAGPSLSCMQFSQQSAFSQWSCINECRLLPHKSEVTSQWQLKYILFSVPFLHNKYRDENSPKYRDGDNAVSRFRRGTLQDELSANHVLAERRRREKLNERFIILRSLVPFVTKMDKASILGDTIEYVKNLRKRIHDLESRTRRMEAEQRKNVLETQKLMNNHKERETRPNTTAQNLGSERSKVPVLDKRKLRILDGAGVAKTRLIGGPITDVQVSIIESDALLELQCSYRYGLLLDLMQTLSELRLEVISIQSSSANGVFTGEFRAKVKENPSGKKVNIVEVKQAIHRILSRLPSY